MGYNCFPGIHALHIWMTINGSILIASELTQTFKGMIVKSNTSRIPGTANTIKVSPAQINSATQTNLFVVISFLNNGEPIDDILNTWNNCEKVSVINATLLVTVASVRSTSLQ